MEPKLASFSLPTVAPELLVRDPERIRKLARPTEVAGGVVLQPVYARTSNVNPGSERPLIGFVLIGLVALVSLAIVGAFGWAVVNGDAAIVTAATALLVFAAGEFFTRGRAANQYRWDKVAPGYERFIKLVRETGQGGNSAKARQESLAVMGELSDQLMLWASPDVVKAWMAMRRLTIGAKSAPSPEVMMEAYSNVLLAIRKDLGHRDWTLDRRDLLGITINDIDEVLERGTHS